MYLGNSRVALPNQFFDDEVDGTWLAVCATGSASGNYGPTGPYNTNTITGIGIKSMEIVGDYLFVAGNFSKTFNSTNIGSTGSVSYIRISNADTNDEWKQFFPSNRLDQGNIYYTSIRNINGTHLLLGGLTGDGVDGWLSLYDVSGSSPTQEGGNLHSPNFITNISNTFTDITLSTGATSADAFCTFTTIFESEGAVLFLFKYDNGNTSIIKFPNHLGSTFGGVGTFSHYYDGGIMVFNQTSSSPNYYYKGSSATSFSNLQLDTNEYYGSFSNKIDTATLYKGEEKAYITSSIFTPTIKEFEAPNILTNITLQNVPSSPQKIYNFNYEGRDFLVVSDQYNQDGQQKIYVYLIGENNIYKDLKFPETNGYINAITVEPATGNIFVGGNFSFTDSLGRTALNVARYVPSSGKFSNL
jgi:hypothetical protein